jgi:hypothetical protein
LGIFIRRSEGTEQRLFNCLVDHAQINQLIAHLEVGHEIDTAAKAQFVNLSDSVASSWQNFPARQAKDSAAEKNKIKHKK